jgi:putative ABC transport system permease protein
MLRNYITVAYRNLVRRKGYTALNVTGLAVGMACCLLIALYVHHELSYDRYHKNADHIFRVVHAYRSGDLPENPPPLAPEEYQVWGNAPVGPALGADFPEIRKVVQFTSPVDLLLQSGEKRFQENNLVFMDSTVFDVFSWKLLYGNPQEALRAPHAIVLTQSTARKYFGDRNPIGQSLRVENKETFTVTGVMEDFPSNSHFAFDGLISMNTFRRWNPNIFTEWGYVDFYTYLLATPQTSLASLKAKVPAFLKRRNDNRWYAMSFEPLSDAYLRSKAGRQPGVTGSLTNVYIFSLIGVFILAIACINFMNLATARSTERAKEVGVRKVVGARQSGLVGQFLTESICIAVLSGGLAFLLAWSALPFMGELSGKAFASAALLRWEVLLLLAITAVVVGVLAGSYPAWVLARFRPVLVIKGNYKNTAGGVALRKGLVVFQFSLSMALIAGTAVVFSQLTHLRTHDLGFRQEQMLVIDFGPDEAVQNRIETIKEIFRAHPAVLSASATRSVPGDFIPNAGTGVQEASGGMVHKIPLIYEIDFDFLPQYGIPVVAGRGFSREFPADTTQSLLLNEAAAKLYGYANPADAVGKRFEQWGREGTVVGVVKNFNFKSLHQPVEPLTLRIAPNGSLSRLSLRIKADNMPATLASLESTWRREAPQRPLVYQFLDEAFNRQYQADLRFGRIFGVFAGLAIFIACLGLFGLATYTAEQRTKEIGIRKVMGASVGSIVALLSKDFIKLVVVSIVIATPVSWYVMHRWLDNFAYRVPIGAGIFVLAGAAAVVIALATISWQSVRAALANPIKSLRSE